jgi:hypothetical protein
MTNVGEHQFDLAEMGDRAIIGQLLALEAKNPGSLTDCKVGKRVIRGDLWGFVNGVI